MNSEELPLTEEEDLGMANIRAFVNQMLSVTVRLVRLDEENKPVGVSSGFIAEKNGRWFLLSTLHSLRKGRYCLETEVIKDGRVLLLTFDAYTFYRRFDLGSGGALGPSAEGAEVDFGWMELDRPKLAKVFAADPRMDGAPVELPLYCGPLDQRPVAGEYYGFAAWNRATVRDLGQTFLFRDYAFEVGLRFDGFDPAKALYRFAIDEAHRGKEFYEGASGAPIADSTGIIVSMLVGGRATQNILWGIPLAELESLIGLDVPPPSVT